MPFDPNLGDDISWMRYEVGDTDDANPLEPDATYQAVLNTHGRELGVGVIAQALATKYAQKPTSISVDEGSFTWNDRIRTWLAKAKQVRDEQGVGTSDLGGSFVATRSGEVTSEYVRSAQTTGTGWWTE